MANRDFAAEWAAQEQKTITLGGENTVRLMADIDPLLLARYVDAQSDISKLSTEDSMRLLGDVLRGLVVPDDHSKLEAALALRGTDYIGITRSMAIIEYGFSEITGRPFARASTSSPAPETPPSTPPSMDSSDSPPAGDSPPQLLRSAP